MRVIGLLSWYDEPVEWLAECVLAAAKLCDHIVAVDGPYALFPGAADRPASPPAQVDAIAATAAAAGIGCTVHVPAEPWRGNEVAKRDFMFRLGMTFAVPQTDWFFRVDADEVLTDVAEDARDVLATTPRDVAEVTMYDLDRLMHWEGPLRALFRALPGIGIQQAHYVVTAPSEHGMRVLAGTTPHRIEPACSLHGIRLRHKHFERSEERKRKKAIYYAAREPFEKPEEVS